MSELFGASFKPGRDNAESALYRRLGAAPDTGAASRTVSVWAAQAGKEVRRDQETPVRARPPAGGVPWTGEVAIRGDGTDNIIQEALSPRGYAGAVFSSLNHTSGGILQLT